MYQKSDFVNQGSQHSSLTACKKKEAPQKMLQDFIKLSYVVLTRDFNMDLVVNILVNVSN